MKYFKCLPPFEENSSTKTSEVETYTKVPEEILNIIPSIKNPDLEKYIPIKIPTGVKIVKVISISIKIFFWMQAL